MADCYTTADGPRKFKECRDWFIQDEEVFETDTRCMNNMETPSAVQKECKMLHKEIPRTKSQLAKVKVKGRKTVSISRSTSCAYLVWLSPC